DGRRVASASYDGTVKVWDLTTHQGVFTLAGHTQQVDRLVFSPDTRRLASCGWDRTVRVWDLTTGREERTLGGLIGGARCVACSRDGSRLLAAIGSAGSDRDEQLPGEVRAWDTTTGQEVFCRQGLIGLSDGEWRHAALSPDGHRLACGLLDGTVK